MQRRAQRKQQIDVDYQSWREALSYVHGLVQASPTVAIARRKRPERVAASTVLTRCSSTSPTGSESE
jgi:hypothetical protein